MDELKQILQDYIINLSSIYRTASESGNATKELSFRPALDDLFVKLSKFVNPKIERVFEPSQQGTSGRPDWLFCNQDSMGVYGYVEAKGFNPEVSLKAKDYEGQVQKYLYLGNPVILTDGVDFIMYSPDGSSDSISICSKPIQWDAIEYNTNLLPFFQKFFKEEGYRLISEKQLVSELSLRAIHLCEDIEELLALEDDEAENETERKTMVSLKNLWEIASVNHDKSLSGSHTFAGFIAQILSFGLLYAHRFINDTNIPPKEKYEKLHVFWKSPDFKNEANRLLPFKTLVQALSEELDSSFSKLGIWYENTRRLLSCIRLSDKQVTTPNFHELYETFLSKYDDKTRVDFGTWYTPMCLAEYMVKFVNTILPSVIPGDKASELPLKIIDPCCGTGTFIEVVLNNMCLHEGSQIIGFEILPVPYALSNYRISMLHPTENVDMEIVLTNTLSDCTFKRTRVEGGHTDSVSTFFINEQRKAKAFSTPPITVIIGNPPCSDSFDSSNEGKTIAKLMNDFRPPIKARVGRSNIQKQVVNEMAKFLRWSLYKAELSRPSVFALVLPSTFATNVSYLNARKYLLEHVSELWVMEFDVDNRAGHNSENLFNTLQGRLFVIGVLRELSFSAVEVHYKSICDLPRTQKVEFLKGNVDLTGWTNVALDKNFTFRPTANVDEDLYTRFWYIASDDEPAIFERHCSGLKLAPTHLLVHFSKGQLKRRSRFIADESNTYEQIKDRWYKGQTKPPAQSKLTSSVKSKLANIEDSIVDYAYRPFLTSSLILNNPLMDELRNTPGGGMRERPEVQAAFAVEGVFGFAVAPAPADISPKIQKFTSFCWNIPDNDLATRGNSHVFCNRFPDYKKGTNWKSDVKNNINLYLLNSLEKEFGYDKDIIADDLIFYSYAILCSDCYMKLFEGKLHTVAGEWPAIPITKDKEIFEKVVEIGKRMAETERGNHLIKPDLLKTVLGSQIDAPFTEHEMFGYTLNRNHVQFKNQQGEQFFRIEIPEEILAFEVSGYNVIREWLKYHSYAYYRKSCSQTDIMDFYNLIGRIAEYKSCVLEVDNLFKNILDSNILLPVKASK